LGSTASVEQVPRTTKISSRMKPGTSRTRARRAHDQAQHDDHEGGRGDVERHQQPAQRPQGVEAVLADGEGDPRPRAQRRQAHDHADDLEQRFQEEVDEVDQRLGPLAHLAAGHPGQHRQQDDLQHHALGEGVDEGGGDDVQQERDDALFLGRFGEGRQLLAVQSAGVDVHADAGLDMTLTTTRPMTRAMVDSTSK
jgi:hypothetical protein